MAITVKVRVKREMTGDKAYKAGDYRQLSVADAERLEATGAVEIVGKPANKSTRQAKKAKGAKPAAKKAAPRVRTQKAPPLTTKGN